jgi:hypothetical protein
MAFFRFLLFRNACCFIARRLPIAGERETHPQQPCSMEGASAVCAQGAQLAGFLEPTATPLDQFLPPKGDPKKPDDDGDKEPPVANLEYATWIAKDQTVSATSCPI